MYGSWLYCSKGYTRGILVITIGRVNSDNGATRGGDVATFAIYTRASEEGSSDHEDQEVSARRWADADPEIEIVEVVSEVVSGALAAEDRGLGVLIDRVEAGELNGIIVRDHKRFARDVIVSSVALDRIIKADGRLIATWTNFDSAHITPELRQDFNIQMSIAQAERERNLLRRVRGKAKAANRGVYCARTPFGYKRDENGRLIPNQDADLVREIFRRRAEGVSFSTLAKREDIPLSRFGLRHLVRNRAYVGEQRIPTEGRKGEPTVIPNSHPPLITEAQFERANAVRGKPPLRSGLSETAQLKGVVRCGTCGRTMHVTGYGSKRDSRGMRLKKTYACPGGCTSLAETKLEPAALQLLSEAIANREPHVAAVIENDTRYSDALAAVEEAQRALAEYRDSIELQRELGMTSFAEGLRVRKKAVEAARCALRETPKPETEPIVAKTLEEADLEDRRAFYRRALAEVRVYPRTAPHRLTLRWAGSDEELPVPEFSPSTLYGLPGIHPKEEALARVAEGATLAQAARAVGVDARTVRRWINEEAS
jgi:DNA invertase Pin-like site-specific DNA recombinase